MIHALICITFLCFGSLSSLVIYRLSPNNNNKDINLFFPRSHCPSCKKNIANINLIPLIGFIKQRGRCSNCNVKISFYYPINEILHLIIGLVLYSILGLSIQLLIAFLIAVILIILFILDYRFFLLPFNINIALLLIGLIAIGYAEIFKISFLDYKNLSMSVAGAFIGFVFLWSVNFFFKLIKGYDGIGGGDFILLASLGSITGPFALPFIILFGSLASILIYFLKIKTLSNQIPLGSGLVLGFLIFILLNYFELLNIYSVL